jgi:hypothetical protein
MYACLQGYPFTFFFFCERDFLLKKKKKTKKQKVAGRKQKVVKFSLLKNRIRNTSTWCFWSRSICLVNGNGVVLFARSLSYSYSYSAYGQWRYSQHRDQADVSVDLFLLSMKLSDRLILNCPSWTLKVLKCPSNNLPTAYQQTHPI